MFSFQNVSNRNEEFTEKHSIDNIWKTIHSYKSNVRKNIFSEILIITKSDLTISNEKYSYQGKAWKNDEKFDEFFLLVLNYKVILHQICQTTKQ